HARIQVAYSTDNGDTWTIRTPHETADELTVDRWHQWLSVGPDGKVYVMFYDTRQDPTRESVDAYFTISEDGGDTWSTPERLTTVSSPDINGTFEFGDYNGMDVVMDRLITIFTDNRDESGGSAQSIDVYAAGRTLDNSTIFGDGFESGDASAWTISFP
ncbi:MAG: sialidase family protein, partial [Acidobacteriota bacterium]